MTDATAQATDSGAVRHTDARLEESAWPRLREAARDVRRRAYAGYSGYHVGAAALADDGRLLVGCNVENASFGVTLCAECGVVSSLHASGGGRLVALACVGAPGSEPARVVLPCGRCRQLLAEHGGADLLIDTPSGPRPLATLLPDAFSADQMRAPDDARQAQA